MHQRIARALLAQGYVALQGWQTVSGGSPQERRFIATQQSIRLDDLGSSEAAGVERFVCLPYETWRDDALQTPLGPHLLTSFDHWIVFDTELQAWRCEGHRAAARRKAAEHLARARQQAANLPSNEYAQGAIRLDSAQPTETEYCALVDEVIERILDGELFQANLSRELTAFWPGAGLDEALWWALRFVEQSSPVYGAVVPINERCLVASASPERFFSLEVTPAGRRVLAEPIKGTRPRSLDRAQDRRLAEELRTSEKDRAENVMIADLVRNDLSRVCTDDSVQVEALCALHTTTRVHHLVTKVAGLLRPEVSLLDVLRAQFPCGSITGAPKLAAMDLIAELEQRRRGIYCGTLGYLAADGRADFSVAIRSVQIEIEDQGVRFRYATGGGITTLSDPTAEWQETIDKSAGFLQALQA